MARKKKQRKQPQRQGTAKMPREGTAAKHKPLVNDMVHIFVDDQNLFWGIVNRELDPGYRIDFGRLLNELSRNKRGQMRPVKTAYIAGVIPDE